MPPPAAALPGRRDLREERKRKRQSVRAPLDRPLTEEKEAGEERSLQAASAR